MDRQFNPNSIWQSIFGQNQQQQSPPFGPPRPPFGQQGPPFGQQQGPPFGQQQGPPFGSPTGGGAPSSPPPSFVPQKSPSTGQVGVFAVDPGAIRPCTFQFVYLWLENGRSFWAWLTFVGRQSAAGFRWNGFRWVYFGIDLRQIQSFQCF
jgi:hypothetical protein